MTSARTWAHSLLAFPSAAASFALSLEIACGWFVVFVFLIITFDLAYKAINYGEFINSKSILGPTCVLAKLLYIIVI